MQAKQLATLARDNAQQFKKIYGGDYYQIISKTGYNEKEITKAMAAVNGDTEAAKSADPVLTGIVKNVITASGAHQWGDSQSLKELTQQASMGLMSGMEETKTKEFDNTWRQKMAL